MFEEANLKQFVPPNILKEIFIFPYITREFYVNLPRTINTFQAMKKFFYSLSVLLFLTVSALAQNELP